MKACLLLSVLLAWAVSACTSDDSRQVEDIPRSTDVDVLGNSSKSPEPPALPIENVTVVEHKPSSEVSPGSSRLLTKSEKQEPKPRLSLVLEVSPSRFSYRDLSAAPTVLARFTNHGSSPVVISSGSLSWSVRRRGGGSLSTKLFRSSGCEWYDHDRKRTDEFLNPGGEVAVCIPWVEFPQPRESGEYEISLTYTNSLSVGLSGPPDVVAAFEELSEASAFILKSKPISIFIE